MEPIVLLLIFVAGCALKWLLRDSTRKMTPGPKRPDDMNPWDN